MALALCASGALSCGVARGGFLELAHRSYARGDYEAAIRNAERSVGLGWPSNTERAVATLIRAQSLERMGRVGDAAALYLLIAERFRGTAQAAQARERLDILQRSGAIRR